jgi:tetraacyldisaccharide 4'-kinase
MKSLSRLLLWPPSQIYSMVMNARNWAYDNGYFKTHRFDLPVVSVGNLTWGGTGKTPILCELIAWALSQGLKPAVISRGYRGQVTGIERVPQNADPSRYGDEPVLISSKFLEVPVYVGADRVESVKEILKNHQVDLIFADDAFQHRRLGRDLDIVIVDCTEPLDQYAVAPIGRSREATHALKRADFVILNKVNLVSPELKNEVIDFVEAQQRELKATWPIIESEYHVKALVRLNGEVISENLKNQAPPAALSALLVSAIGNPKSFERILPAHVRMQGHLIYRDHHAYTQGDLKKIIAEAHRLKVDQILITEKDSVKLSKLGADQQLFCVVQLAPKLGLRVKQLYEVLRQLVR